MSVGRRLSSAAGSHLVVIDALVSAGLLLVGLAGRWANQRVTPVSVALGVPLVLLLPLRRRRPWPVFLAMVALAGGQWLADGHTSTDAVLLAALYTVTTQEPRRRALAAVAMMELGVLFVSIRLAPTRNGAAASFVFLSAMVTAAYFVGTTIRARRLHLAELVDRAERLERERDTQSRLAATAERGRIARELHDIVAHTLSVVTVLADGAALANRGGPAEATQAMHQVAAASREALGEMRRLLGVLRDDLPAIGSGGATAGGSAGAVAPPQPQLADLDELVNRMRAAGLPVRMVVAGRPLALPATCQTAVYRVVQESLTNTVRHSGDVRRVDVRLAWDPDGLSVDVVDDGTGAEASRVPVGGGPPGSSTGSGFGLVGMRERVELFGGTVRFGPRAGGGWAVRARLPVAALAVGPP